MAINKTHINQCSDFTTSAKSALFKTFEEAGGGGSTEPAGEDRELQLNDNGSFGGAALLSSPGTDEVYGPYTTILQASKPILGIAPVEAEGFSQVTLSTDTDNEANCALTMLQSGGLTSISLGTSADADGRAAGLFLNNITENTASVSVTDSLGTIEQSTCRVKLGEVKLAVLDNGSFSKASVVLSSTGSGGPQTGNVAIGGGLVVDSKPLSELEGVLFPASAHENAIVIASDGRKSGETEGNGTGCPVWSDGTNWLTFYDNSVVQN